ncbi:GNAT family N-acetyltransferase [Mailhella massiliensis]|uniref:GNAT family N-acetyltransferase n=1 Tax=Mailhella massiliensis TaxID=1903261 RepID=A0A921AX29_9BACT|nr:GNAT family N-acetyltransferase [Mailhella massiliensis]HJD97917.1 GNAT family N-acetyltransferase [Mailhella massiliensis]
MDIRLITRDKKRFLPLLLEADEQESMIDRYLERGKLFVLFQDEEPAAVAVITKEADGVYELKNLAVAEALRRKGLGRGMVGALFTHYRGRGIMLVGTGDSPATLGFYRACGFAFSHVEKDFFVKNYDHPIVENGRRLTDMIYLKKAL